MLVAGDTAGLIAVFDVKDYCMVTGKVGTTSASLCFDKWNGCKDAFFSFFSVSLCFFSVCYKLLTVQMHCFMLKVLVCTAGP